MNGRITKGPRKKKIRIIVATLLFLFLAVSLIEDNKATVFINKVKDNKVNKVCPNHVLSIWAKFANMTMKIRSMQANNRTIRFFPTRIPTAFLPADIGSILKKSYELPVISFVMAEPELIAPQIQRTRA